MSDPDVTEDFFENIVIVLFGVNADGFILLWGAYAYALRQPCPAAFAAFGTIRWMVCRLK